jgi:hypothetical protein
MEGRITLRDRPVFDPSRKRTESRHDLRLEAAVAITRRFEVDFPGITPYGFGCGAIAGVASAAAIRIVLGIAEVLFQFEFQESLERVLHQHFRFRFSSTAFGTGCFADRGCGELQSPFGSLRPTTPNACLSNSETTYT